MHPSLGASTYEENFWVMRQVHASVYLELFSRVYIPINCVAYAAVCPHQASISSGFLILAALMGLNAGDISWLVFCLFV